MPVAKFAVEAEPFLAKALHWADTFDSCCLLHSNGFSDPYARISSLLAVGVRDEFVADNNRTFDQIENFKTKYPNEWVLGFLSYELKNEIEELQTVHTDALSFPNAYFFVPQIVLEFQDNELSIVAHGDADPDRIFQDIQASTPPAQDSTLGKPFQKRMSKAAYTAAFHQLKNHIRRGDIYEVNLCQEFYQESCTIDPTAVYQQLNGISPTPFSTFFKFRKQYILSASPERFIAKRSTILLSQPIKGTAKRGSTPAEDEAIKQRLQADPKEIAENVMIVDLVRNDLTRSAKPGTVVAERQPAIHTFRQVHQLVSTISCEIDPMVTDLEAIKRVFPAGSMTGAPKLSAMQLCDRYENSRRGVYSGAVGYFAPNGDFDFNVVIRTLLYNRENGYLSFHTGGAITIDADAQKEYAECLLKAQAILNALGTYLID